jgi:hypothetical protein
MAQSTLADGRGVLLSVTALLGRLTIDETEQNTRLRQIQAFTERETTLKEQLADTGQQLELCKSQCDQLRQSAEAKLPSDQYSAQARRVLTTVAVELPPYKRVLRSLVVTIWGFFFSIYFWRFWWEHRGSRAHRQLNPATSTPPHPRELSQTHKQTPTALRSSIFIEKRRHSINSSPTHTQQLLLPCVRCPQWAYRPHWGLSSK